MADLHSLQEYTLQAIQSNVGLPQCSGSSMMVCAPQKQSKVALLVLPGAVAHKKESLDSALLGLCQRVMLSWVWSVFLKSGCMKRGSGLPSSKISHGPEEVAWCRYCFCTRYYNLKDLLHRVCFWQLQVKCKGACWRCITDGNAYMSQRNLAAQAIVGNAGLKGQEVFAPGFKSLYMPASCSCSKGMESQVQPPISKRTWALASLEMKFEALLPRLCAMLARQLFFGLWVFWQVLNT